MFELPWWALIIVGFFIGIVTEFALALVIIYLRNRGKTPASFQRADDLTRACGIYDVGKSPNPEMKVEGQYVCLRVDLVLKLANDMEKAKVVLESIRDGMKDGLKEKKGN